MRLHLVRHAHAGDPQRWAWDNDLRPLSEKGMRQAAGVAAVLGDGPFAALVSSPSLRCMATLLPLARTQERDLLIDRRIYEGRDPRRALAALTALPDDGDCVACSHGDIIAGILGEVAESGVALDSDRFAKGSIWTFEIKGGRVVAASYQEPVER